MFQAEEAYNTASPGSFLSANRERAGSGVGGQNDNGVITMERLAGLGSLMLATLISWCVISLAPNWGDKPLQPAEPVCPANQHGDPACDMRPTDHHAGGGSANVPQLYQRVEDAIALSPGQLINDHYVLSDLIQALGVTYVEEGASSHVQDFAFSIPEFQRSGLLTDRPDEEEDDDDHDDEEGRLRRRDREEEEDENDENDDEESLVIGLALTAEKSNTISSSNRPIALSPSPSRSAASASAAGGSGSGTGSSLQCMGGQLIKQWWGGRRRKGSGGRGGGATGAAGGEEAYRLGKKFEGGGHGEIWRAFRVMPDGFTLSPEKFVMKRMLVEGHMDIWRCGLREIYYGKKFRGRPHVARYVEHFYRNSSESGMELWIVFHDEGTSLRRFLYSPSKAPTSSPPTSSSLNQKEGGRRGSGGGGRGPAAVAEGTNKGGATAAEGTNGAAAEGAAAGGGVLFEPSEFWRQMRLADGGREVLKALMRQILEGTAEVHNTGATHRDLKPSNIILSLKDGQAVVKLADFSSAVDRETLANGMYGGLGPTQEEETREYQPPEVIFNASMPYHHDDPQSYDAWSIGVIFLELILGTPHVFTVDQRTRAILAHQLRKETEAVRRRAYLLAALADFCVSSPERPGWELTPRVGSMNHQYNDFNSPPESSSSSSHPPSNPARSPTPTMQSKSSKISKTSSGSSNKHRGGATGAGELEGGDDQQHHHRSSGSRRHAHHHAHHTSSSSRSSSSSPSSPQDYQCTLEDLRKALQQRDPLDLGLHDPWALHLLSRLLRWDPHERIRPAEALEHAYFKGPYISTIDGSEHATPHDLRHYESQLEAIKTRYDPNSKALYDPQPLPRYPGVGPPQEQEEEGPSSFTCPQCGRTFPSWTSCHSHVTGRKHGLFCRYDTSDLPSCIGSHSMLPLDPHSGWCDVQGRRKTIEDFHSIVYSEAYKFYGVFDGHWGTRAAKLTSLALHAHIISAWLDAGETLEVAVRQAFYRTNEDLRRLSISSSTSSNMSTTNATGIRNEGEAKENDDQEPKHQQQVRAKSTHSNNSHKTLPRQAMDRSGTTATIAMVFPHQLVVANVGDSRAILCCDEEGKSVELTVDHTASNSEERAMLEAKGAKVSEKGVWRLQGDLALSRSIGDFAYDHFLSREPHIKIYPLPQTLAGGRSKGKVTAKKHKKGQNKKEKREEEEGDEEDHLFMVLASDGLWDVMENDEVVAFLKEKAKEMRLVMQLQKIEGKQQIGEGGGGGGVLDYHVLARDLTWEAYVRGSTDNIGVCIVHLHQD